MFYLVLSCRCFTILFCLLLYHTFLLTAVSYFSARCRIIFSARCGVMLVCPPLYHAGGGGSLENLCFVHVAAFLFENLHF